MLQAGLMSRDETQNNAPVITRSGFQFLLMERSSQVPSSPSWAGSNANL
jgi:hypothetical protein